MSKNIKPLKRTIKPLNFVNKLLNLFIKNGKRNKAFNLLFDVLKILRKKKRRNISFETFFNQVLLNTRFSVNLYNIHISRRRSISIPKMTTLLKENTRSARIIIENIKNNKSKKIKDAYSLELWNIFQGKSNKTFQTVKNIKKDIRKNKYLVKRLKKI